ncbi:MAG: T9SS type A sorting domain-containing protein [Bacteroidales bacterium]|nr:T9SS type A sorting domain-containing protein [Bacteroidales bacterium]
MKISRFLLNAIFLLASFSAFSQSLPIALDGQFSDWATAGSVFTDSQGDGAAIDMLSLSVSNDSAYLYIRLTLAEEIQLNAGNELFLEMDTDNDPYTGYSVNGIGAELGWKLGGRFGYFTPGGSSIYVEQADFGFYALPTVTGNTFEMAIDRNAYPDNTNPLFTSDTIKICLVDQAVNGDLMPNSGQTFTYIFDDTPVQAYTPVDLAKGDVWHVRLLTYNTLNNGLIDPQRQASFGRIIQAISPDIITFNECYGTQWYQARDLLDAWLPLPGSASWNCWKIDGSNITCSRYPILQNWQILPDRRLTASLIDLPVEYLHDVVVINAHFKCCDGDSIRQREADAFINFVRDIKTPGGLIDVPAGTPFVLSGDLNLVGLSQQLTTLLTGDIQDTAQFGSPIAPDWDNTELADIISLQADQRMAFTWQDYASDYWPGRLDFTIASEVDFEAEKTFIINTGIMSTARLLQNGLLQNDTETASDHFPKVTDFSMPLILDLPEQGKIDLKYKIYPNPTDGDFCVEIFSSSSVEGAIEFFDITGQPFPIDDRKKNQNNITKFTLSGRNLKPGLYFIKITLDDNQMIEKLVISN